MALRIGIFADDIGGSHAAALLGHGLSRAGRSVTVVAPGVRQGYGLRKDPGGAVYGDASSGRTNAFEVQAVLERCRGRDEDCIMALPLSALREQAVRHQFDAVLAVGREQPAAVRALRATRYEASGAEDVDGAPPWFLACAGQDDLRTRANLRSGRGPGLPFAVRSLPAPLPRLGAVKGGALLRGCPDAATARDGILLAASVVAVVADPHAPGIDAATLVRLMATRDLAAERETRDLLVGLADAYDGPEAGVDDGAARYRSRGSMSARRPSPARRDAVEVRNAGDERDAQRTRTSRGRHRR